MKKHQYRIMVKIGSNLRVEEQEDYLMLSTIRSILGREKCVQIGNTIYTLDNVIKIEESIKNT